MIIFDLDDTLYDRSGSLTDSLNGLEGIRPFPGVKEFLQRKDFRKVLITKGKKKLQDLKLDLLGIRNFFDEIIICEGSEGKMKSLRRFSEKSGEKWVVGNRIDEEIIFGHELGFKTVWLKHGKYKNLKAAFHPDHTINTFLEIGRLVPCKP